jgi:DNA ligase 1
MFALLTDWTDTDPTGWLMSEKLDGFRVMWTGSAYVTRNGKTLEAPRSWYRRMPKTPLDGELFGGYGSLYEVRRMMSRGWKGLSFRPFDAPACAGGFADRLTHLQSLTLPGHCQLVPHAVCNGREELQAFACEVYAQGGEGAVVRDPAAPYAVGRTKTVQRLVPYPLRMHRR